MSDAEQPIPEIYREAAEQVRQLARIAQLTNIRGDLLELAARFERLAAYADAAIRQGLPGYPQVGVLRSVAILRAPAPEASSRRRTALSARALLVQAHTPGEAGPFQHAPGLLTAPAGWNADQIQGFQDWNPSGQSAPMEFRMSGKKDVQQKSKGGYRHHDY